MTEKQLTIWNDTERAVPNSIARSALFNVDNVRSAGERKYVKDVEIVTGRPFTITYTGDQLRQDDADVWLQLVHMSRENLGEKIEFTSYAMLKELGWSDRAGNRKRLFEILRRLNRAQLVVNNQEAGTGYVGVLVFDFASRLHERTWAVRLNTNLAALFVPAGYTRIDWETRKPLSPIGKWLHYYVTSHKTQYPVSFDSLRMLSGSNATNADEWRRSVLKAVKQLEELKVLKSWSIESDGKLWPKR